MKHRRKWIWALALGAALVLSFAAIYWLYFLNPSSFPNDEQLVGEINSLLPEAEAREIQDTIFVDERHVLAPFISEKERYGLSYWKWDKHKWIIAEIDTDGEPRLWKVKPENPTTYRMVWNLYPGSSVNSFDIYLIRERDASGIGDWEQYIPRIQMVLNVPLQKESYGAMKLPGEWVEVIDSLGKWETQRKPDRLFSQVFYQDSFYFGWLPLDQNQQVSFPEHSVNGLSYGNLPLDLDYISIINQVELEQY